jgi:ATP-dependent DNA ligase
MPENGCRMVKLRWYALFQGSAKRYIAAMTKSSRAAPRDALPTRRTVEPAPPPAWIKPQLAKLVENAPDGSGWLHEIKFDGYRMHARLDAGRVQILTRRLVRGSHS